MSPASNTSGGNAPVSTRVLRSPGLPAALFLGLLVLLLAVYARSVGEIVAPWNPDGGYSHGWLILGLIGWIFWERRRQLFTTVSGSHWPGVVSGMGFVCVWLAADLVSVQAVQHLALLGLILSLPLVGFGWRGGLALAGALSLLVFTLPIWDMTVPALQAMTVRAVDFCLAVSRIPAYIVDNQVTIPAGQFRIVQGCSGMHFFVSGFALAAVYAYLYLRTWTHRFVLISTTLLVAMVANWIRVYVVILAGYLTQMQHYLVQVDHYLFGWVLFGVALVPVFFLANHLERREEQAGVTLLSTPTAGSRSSQSGLPRWSVAALLLILAGPVGRLALAADRETLTWCPRALPEVSGWDLEALGTDLWRPDFHGETVALAGRYRRGDEEIVVWTLYYEQQRQGRELIFFSHRPFDPEQWRQTGRSASVVAGLPESRLTLQGPDDQRRRLSYWYEVGGRTTDRRMTAKALQIPSLLAGREDGAFIGITGLCAEDCKSTDLAIDQILQSYGPALTRTPVARDCEDRL